MAPPTAAAHTPPVQRITAHNGPWPLLDAAASRAHEAAALAGQPPGALMALAGQAVAKLLWARWPHARRVTVWAGPGNNGGDGLVAARLLHQAGCAVQVLLVADSPRRPPDAAAALAAARAAGVSISAWPGGTVAEADVAIDALLGLGADRPPSGDLAEAIGAMNAQGLPILAVDLPTGLSPDTGSVLGDSAVRATATLQLLNLKPGCLTHRGRDHAGELWLCDLGHPAATVAATATLAGPPIVRPRAHASHKGSYGDVAVVGGAPGMVGAPWLAGAAALAAGAGRVYVSLLDEPPQAAIQPELMTRSRWWLSPPSVLSATTVVAGCGGGTAIAATLPALLAHAGRLVLDADALNALAADSALLALLQHRRAPSLLTPHPLEAARLLGVTAQDVQAHRPHAAQSLARLTGATVLLKGSGTVLAEPDGPLLINPSGNAALATAGSGDVLAGWSAGLWVAAPTRTALDIATQAAWQHGNAADRYALHHPDQPLRASELVQWLSSPRQAG